MTDPDQLNLIVTFNAVAEQLSFAKAAVELNVMPSTISRQIARLEDNLGVRLFDRTTRHVALTEAGRLYHAQCLRIIESLNEADAMMASFNSEPRGLLRISLPVALGRLYISSALNDFLGIHKEVQIQADFSDRFVNLIDEGYDMAVRIGNLSDSGIVARRVADNPRILVATPEYVDRHGSPSTPNDLFAHQCLCFSHYSGLGTVWRFRRGERMETVTVSGRFVSDSSDAVYEAALKGLGIALLATYVCHSDVSAGKLFRLMPDWTSHPESGIYIVYPSQRYLSPKVRALAEFLFKRLRKEEWGEQDLPRFARTRGNGGRS